MSVSAREKFGRSRDLVVGGKNRERELTKGDRGSRTRLEGKTGWWVEREYKGSRGEESWLALIPQNSSTRTQTLEGP